MSAGELEAVCHLQAELVEFTVSVCICCLVGRVVSSDVGALAQVVVGADVGTGDFGIAFFLGSVVHTQGDGAHGHAHANDGLLVGGIPPNQ